MHLKVLWACLMAFLLITHAKQPPFYLDRSLVPGGYLVQFTEEGNLTKAIQEIVQGLQQHNPSRVQVIHQFDHPLFRGVSLRVYGLPDNVVRSLIVHNHVASVHPVVAVVRPQIEPLATSIEPTPDLQAMIPHAMTQVDRVHRELNTTGKGILIGVIDSGVDYYHPALGGGFGPGFKISHGRDLVGSSYNSIHSISSVSHQDPLDDCPAGTGGGHGTHVSGIIAGKSENFTGVAPDATLGMWRVFGCKGDTSEDIIIQAMLEAYDAGCDIISMSLGSFVGWSEDVMAVVAQRIVEKGIPVVVAAGNDGGMGAFTVGSPSTGLGTFSVGSFDNNYNLRRFFTIDADPRPFEYTDNKNSISVPATWELVAGTTEDSSSDDGCDPSRMRNDAQGKYVLLQRGSCAFDVKAQNAAAIGAIGVVVYNNVNASFTPSTSTATIPVIGISKKDGESILMLLAKQASLLLHFKKAVVKTDTGSTVSLFSSVGPTYDGNLNPMISGIGGFVYSTLPRVMGSWGIMSGTSMATPYVAGAIALYLSSLNGPKPSPAFIAEQLQNYAYQAVHENEESTIDSPLRQGAGLVQVLDAIQQPVHISPGFVSFNDTSSPALSHTLTITNAGSTTVIYQLFNNPAVAVAPYNLENSSYSMTEPANFVTLDAQIQFSSETVMVSPGASQNITATVIPPPSADPTQHIMYGGYIQFKPQHAAPDIHVPYFGIAGDQRQLPILGDDTPYLSDRTFDVIVPLNETYQFDLKDASTKPYIVFRVLTPTARVIYDVLDDQTGSVLGKAMPDTEYIGRNTNNSPYDTVSWAGTFQPSLSLTPDMPVPVSPGFYRLRLKALKLYGNPLNETDWEVWISPRIQVR